jgi:hypothetical protein
MRHIYPVQCCELLALLLIATLAACGSTHDESVSEASLNRGDTILGITGTVLPLSQGPALVRPCTRVGARGVIGFYLPPSDQVVTLETRLPNALHSVRSTRSSRDRISPPFGNYYRQYIGLVRAGNQRAIYINAFPREDLSSMNDLLRRVPKRSKFDPDTTAWREVPIAPCDGGDSFWSLEYDPNTRTFREFRPSQGAG